MLFKKSYNQRHLLDYVLSQWMEQCLHTVRAKKNSLSVVELLLFLSSETLKLIDYIFCLFWFFFFSKIHRYFVQKDKSKTSVLPKYPMMCVTRNSDNHLLSYFNIFLDGLSTEDKCEARKTK